jgi:hypothetical protein
VRRPFVPLLGDATPEDVAAIEALKHVSNPTRVYGAYRRIVEGCGCGCFSGGSKLAKSESGWPDRKGPLPLLAKRHGLTYRGYYPGWVDHPYRVKTEKGWQYIAEPYGLTDCKTAFSDLAWLANEHGYDVQVSAWQARHFPGSTLAIILTPPDIREAKARAAGRPES